jgi:signal transduction histidine kinase
MTRTDALQFLQTGSTHARLKAARFLLKNTENADLPLLNRLRAQETDVYVIAAIDLAIESCRSKRRRARPARADGPEGVTDETRAEIYGQAVKWVSGMLLHEIGSPLGLLEAAAVREIGGRYEGSAVERRMQAIRNAFDAIEQLQTAATPAKPTQFDLADHLNQAIYDVANGRAEIVSAHGQTPLTIRSDPKLLDLAFRNGLRNALEAVVGMDREDAKSLVVVSWGATDTDVWVTIVDRGPGLPESVEKAFDIGQTTKKDHRGFGLAIAKQAMDTLGGTVILSRAAGGGASYELQWERT